MKSYLIAATFLMMSANGFAQEAAPIVVDPSAPAVVEQSAPTVVEQTAPAIAVQPAPVVVEQPASAVVEQKAATIVVPAASPAIQQRQPIIIVNQPPAQAPVQAQPIIVQQPAQAVVVPSATTETSAIDARTEELRKSRQNLEENTEHRLYEKLEKARLEDEQKRAQKIFGPQPAPVVAPVEAATPATPVAPVTAPAAPAVEAQATQTVPAAAAGSATVPVQVIPAPVAVQPQAEAQVPAQAVAPVAADTKAEDDVVSPEELPSKNMFISGSLGLTEYPDTVNVTGHYAAGVSWGVLFPQRYSLEGFFNYATYDVEQLDPYGYSYDPYYPWIKNMTQYSLGGIAKYRFFDGDFTPVVGGIGALVYRNYQDNSGWGTGRKETSTAFDVGALIGFDYKLNRSFSVGGDFRYMTNLGYNSTKNSDQYYSGAQNIKALERVNYYMLGVNLTYWF